jgi:hypothetical protein
MKQEVKVIEEIQKAFEDIHKECVIKNMLICLSGSEVSLINPKIVTLVNNEELGYIKFEEVMTRMMLESTPFVCLADYPFELKQRVNVLSTIQIPVELVYSNIVMKKCSEEVFSELDDYVNEVFYHTANDYITVLNNTRKSLWFKIVKKFGSMVTERVPNIGCNDASLTLKERQLKHKIKIIDYIIKFYSHFYANYIAEDI